MIFGTNRLLSVGNDALGYFFKIICQTVPKIMLVEWATNH